MFGRSARVPEDVMYSLPVSGSTPTRYAAQLRRRLSYAYDRVRAFSKRQQDRQKDTYDQRVRGEPYVAVPCRKRTLFQSHLTTISTLHDYNSGVEPPRKLKFRV